MMNIFSMSQFSPAILEMLTDPRPVPIPQEMQLKGALAFLFEQPSLRTASSFAAAGVAVGLSPVFINTSAGSEFRSQTDLEDEIHQLTLTGARFVVVRTSRVLQAEKFAKVRVPVLSGGDGPNEHPTQAMIDIMTMRTFGEIQGKNIVLMGNARDHRTLHSLALGLERFDVKVTLIAPEGMDLPSRYYTKNMQVHTFSSKKQREDILRNADFVYISPIKFNNNPHLRDEHGVASLNYTEARELLKPTAKVLHPFPRFGELSKDLDFTCYDAYHLQAQLGIQLRVRLFQYLMG